jgi:hypothetical protein
MGMVKNQVEMSTHPIVIVHCLILRREIPAPCALIVPDLARNFHRSKVKKFRTMRMLPARSSRARSPTIRRHHRHSCHRPPRRDSNYRSTTTTRRIASPCLWITYIRTYPPELPSLSIPNRIASRTNDTASSSVIDRLSRRRRLPSTDDSPKCESRYHNRYDEPLPILGIPFVPIAYIAPSSNPPPSVSYPHITLYVHVASSAAPGRMVEISPPTHPTPKAPIIL